MKQRRRWRVGAVVAFLMGMFVVVAPPASAAFGISVTSTFPSTTAVGQTFPASVLIGNNSTAGDASLTLQVRDILLSPSCQDALCTTADAGVYALSATGTGSGPASCVGTWTIVPEQAGYRFIPPGGPNTLLLTGGESCQISFTAVTRRLPAVDGAPSVPGLQTYQVARATAFSGSTQVAQSSGASISTVSFGASLLTTQAAMAPAGPPALATTTDTATFAPAPPSNGAGVPPTGEIIFVLYGPDDFGCVAPPVATVRVPVNGYGTYTTPEPVALMQPGSYSWFAVYTGDIFLRPKICASRKTEVVFLLRPQSCSGRRSRGREG